MLFRGKNHMGELRVPRRVQKHPQNCKGVSTQKVVFFLFEILTQIGKHCKLYFAIQSGSIQSPYNLADRFKIHLIVRFDTWNSRVHIVDPISSGRAVMPAVQKAHNQWSVVCGKWQSCSGLPSSRPESRIMDQKLAFSYQNPFIEPPYKIARKQLKVSIDWFPRSFFF